jgi:hypothetical protein
MATPQRLVVRDANAWRDTWTAIWRDVSPPPPLPVVDFSRDMVVVAALGQRPTGGFSIVIADARVENGGLRVTVRTVSPGPGCGTTLAITQPVDAARLPRFDGRVTYDDVSIVQDCR